jgi:hypothetical protein
VQYRILKHERPYARLHDPEHCRWLDGPNADHAPVAASYHVVTLTAAEAARRPKCSLCQ